MKSPPPLMRSAKTLCCVLVFCIVGVLFVACSSSGQVQSDGQTKGDAGQAPTEGTPQTRDIPKTNTLLVDPMVAKSDPERQVYKDISTALKVADGKVIQVKTGVYQENLTIPANTTVTLLGDPKTRPRLLAERSSAAITVETGAKLTIRDFQIEGGGRGIEAKDNTVLMIQTLTFKDNVGQGLAATNAKVQISDSRFEGTKKPDDKDFKRLGNPHGLRADGGSLSVNQCSFNATGNHGILLTNKASAWINDSTFSTSQKGAISAISIQKGASGYVEKSQISGWKEGIFLFEGRGSIYNTKIEKMRGHGILAGSKSWIHVEDSTITDTTEGGIAFSKSSGTLRNNTLSQNKAYGIFVEQGESGGSTLIENNTLSQVGAAAIQILNSDSVFVQGNQIKGVVRGKAGDDGHGIAALDSAALVLRGNRIENAVAYGINLLRSAGLVQGNTIEGCKEAGIVIARTPAAQSVQILANTLTKNTIAGVFLLQGRASFAKNHIRQTIYSKSDQAGSGMVLFQQSEARIDGGLYEGNEQHGVMVLSGSFADIKNSTFRSNQFNGIFVQCGAARLLNKDNKFEKNGSKRNPCP